MLERIKNCLCHPRMIGKYFKDKVSTVIITILLFFGVYACVLGMKTYSEDYFPDDAISIVVSEIFQGNVSNIKYDHKTGVLSGGSTVYKGNGFIVTFCDPENKDAKSLYSDIAIMFNSDCVELYSTGFMVGKVSYKDINAGDFSISGIKNNAVSDIYNFKVILRAAFDSSNLFFLTFDFFSELLTTALTYLFSVLLLFFFSKYLNPTIEGKIRTKLCFYDGLIMFFVAILGVLFNASWLTFIAVIFPIIFGNITFKHIVRVSVKKKDGESQ